MIWEEKRTPDGSDGTEITVRLVDGPLGWSASVRTFIWPSGPGHVDDDGLVDFADWSVYSIARGNAAYSASGRTPDLETGKKIAEFVVRALADAPKRDLPEDE